MAAMAGHPLDDAIATKHLPLVVELRPALQPHEALLRVDRLAADELCRPYTTVAKEHRAVEHQALVLRRWIG